MNISNKKTIRKLLIISFLIVFGFLLLQMWAKSFVEDFLMQKIPTPYVVTYSELDINLLFGNIILNNPSVKIEHKDAPDYKTNLELESLQINGIGYWNLLFNEHISISNVQLIAPKLTYYPKKQEVLKSNDTQTSKNALKVIRVKEFNILNGDINVMGQNTDSIAFSVSSYDLTILDGIVNMKSLEGNPLTYNSYQLNAEDIILNNSKYDSFKIDNVNSNEELWHIDNLQIIPKYDKKELSKHLNKERDYINLNISKVILEQPHFKYSNKRFGFIISSAKLIEPNLEIYRDKLLPNDSSVKPLYSESLRDLHFDLEIKKVEIENGYISYAELVELDKKAGKLFFSQVNGTLNHLSNLKNAKKTKINLHSKLMSKAPLELNWSFDVNNTSEAFEVSGSINNLPADILNPFLKPNLKVLAEGTLQQMYFSFYGNNLKSEGEMKMRYEDFRFKLLQKNGLKINKVLTAIANIFVVSESKTDTEKYRYGEISADRNNTKSFFNYLWINLKSGIISTLTGSGDIKK